MSKDPYRYFRVEARELLDEMSRAVLDLEKGEPTSNGVSKLLRLAHTLKGAARVVRQPGIADQAHAIEDTLTPWREAVEAVPREALNQLLSGLDQIEGHLAALATATDAVAPDLSMAAGARKPGLGVDEAWRTVRSDSGELSAVLEGITESHAHVVNLRRHLDMAVQGSELARLLLDQLTLRRGRGGLPAARGRDFEAVREMAEDLSAMLGRLDAGLSRTTDQLDRELRETKDTAEQLRLVPARQLFTSLARTVRDVAQAQGKQVAFTGLGGDMRLDGDILGGVQPALVQMVRNAVAHGIETVDQRRTAGKDVQGHVTVEVRREGRYVVFTCADDGAGVDLEAVAQAARRQGIWSGEQMPDVPSVLHLLMRGGVSTAGSVTALSGRGVGMNVVSESLDRLGGDASLETARGQGTTWALKVPLSMASIAVLGVESHGVGASIPLAAVKQTLRVHAHDMADGLEGPSFIHDGVVVPFIELSCVLHGTSETARRRTWSTVVVQGLEGLVAVGVDRLLGAASVVLRPLPELAPASALIAGVSLDVEGHPQLVLDPQGLVMSARSRQVQDVAPAFVQMPILVVDDSLTTRMLEQSILESAGYLVHTAVSAEEALVLAGQHRYGLFLVDVDMPGMDGFEFVRTVQADPVWRDIPAILVTSRASPEDRQRGRDVGARDYIVKGEFAQTAFLDSVRRLITTKQGA